MSDFGVSGEIQNKVSELQGAVQKMLNKKFKIFSRKSFQEKPEGIREVALDCQLDTVFFEVEGVFFHRFLLKKTGTA